MTTTVRTIFSINATARSHDFLVIRRGPAGISIEAQSREDEWESATAGPFTPEQLRAALDEVAPAGSHPRTDEDWKARAERAEEERDHLTTVLETTARQRDEADKRNARPLTPDAITDEMVLRFWNAFNGLNDGLEDMTLMSIDEVRAGLSAALTEPPARPEGAERWEDFLIDSLDYQALTDQQITDLADRIAEEMNR